MLNLISEYCEAIEITIFDIREDDEVIFGVKEEILKHVKVQNQATGNDNSSGRLFKDGSRTSAGQLVNFAVIQRNL